MAGMSTGIVGMFVLAWWLERKWSAESWADHCRTHDEDWR